MEDYGVKRVVLGLLLTFVFSPSVAFAYEVKTHAGLTQATVETYLKSQNKSFQEAEISAIVKGSSDEDVDERPVNHFFDPIHDRGLKVGLISWSASKRWAQDTEGQANFCIQKLCFSKIGYADKYFSSPIDYSWDRAIYEYAHGNKERGLEGLGHILHLLQDASVPAHVRNDQHLNKWGGGDFDLYEQYAGKYGQGDVSALEQASILQRQNLSSYFDMLAGFTNGHFLSQDTIFKKYEYPKLSQLEVRDDGFAYDVVFKHKIALVKSKRDSLGNMETSIYLTDPAASSERNVLGDYWALLSKEAIKNGVGVIDLFFKEVEKEKQSLVLKKKNVSQQDIDARKVMLKGFSFAKKLYGSSLDEDDVADLTSDQSASAVNAFDSNSTEPTQPQKQLTPVVVTPKPQVPTQKKVAVVVPEEVSVEEFEETILPSEVATSTEERIVPVNNPLQVGVGGGGNAPVSTPTPIVTVGTPVFTSPSQSALFGTTTVTLAGTSDANALISLSITEQGGATSTATTSANSSGIWSLAITAAEGTTTISATASDSNGNTSSSASLSYISDITAPSVSVFSLLECSYTLVVGTCTTAGSASPQLTAPSSDVSYYTYIVDGGVVSTSSALTSITLSTGARTVAIAAYDMAGNGATSSAVSIEALNMPLVINEVGWMGTSVSASASWLEIYNRSSHSIDMSQVNLSTSDGANSFNLSGTLASGAYYLIENNETNTSESAEHISASFTLSSTPVQITLSHIANGAATTTIDATPVASVCGSSWCAGTTGGSNLSMEREQPAVVGTLASNWGSNNTVIKRGSDGSVLMNATLRYRNSITVDSIGFSNGPSFNTFFIEGGHYQPLTGDFRFLDTALIGTQHYVSLYVGTVGSSTVLLETPTGSATDSTINTSAIPAQYQVQDQDFFATIILLTPGPMASVEAGQFRDYFTTGVGSTPNSYGILRFKWGP